MRAVSLVTALTLFAPAAASANARRFSYSHESAVLPKGTRELEFWTTNRIGRDTHYSRFDNRLEVEYGLTDQLMAAWYVNTRAVSAEDPTSGAVAKSFSFEGVSAELKYKLADPMADAVGLALYGEVTYGPGEVALESKLILDKRVGQVIYAGNLVAEAEFGGIGTKVEKVYEGKLTGGAAYFVTDRLAIGAELELEAEVEEGEFEGAGLFGGPQVSWSGDALWLVLSVLPQIGHFGGDHDGFKRDLVGSESVHARLLVGSDF
jgi:hypothetical protein